MVRPRETGSEGALSSSHEEERIFVAIRVRPLNEKERSRNDECEWECVSGNTIRFKGSGVAEQRSSSMDEYSFDRAFAETCTTQQVYDQGIKAVALSVLRGINSSIFAYGQTSSGKTYTMNGITEYAVKDIYDYIEKHKEREFSVKFSAMEIYNEAVRDLLSANNTQLRLLDDPERGTIVEKLTEETLTDRSQLQQLLLICAAQRTTEETAMNETSSRSHQILRLTVESNPGDYMATASSGTLVASVNFVDLAGSERASQALSAGQRLREGSHINRSLLSLGTVIRKLSKERNGHIPYRDSKLTRIVQNSLGGNARTAIICTISPARSQVEQSRNTLFFAGCAKQVTTNAKINVVMSDKILVKQLQQQLARMENELRSITPNTALLKERELQIEEMDKEIKELTWQRDLLLQSVGKDRHVRVDQDRASEWAGAIADDLPFGTDSPSQNPDKTDQLLQQPENSEDNSLLDGSPPMFGGPDPCQGWEKMAREANSKGSRKEVGCNETEVKTGHKTDCNPSGPVLKEKEVNSSMMQVLNVDANSSSMNRHSELSHVPEDDNQDALQQNTQDLQNVTVLEEHSEKSNKSSEFEPQTSCTPTLAALSPQNTQDLPNATVLLEEHSEKSNKSWEFKPQISCTPILAAMSPQIEKVNRETASHPQLDQKVIAPSPQLSKLDQKVVAPSRFNKKAVSPSHFNKLDEPTTPTQFDEQELKTPLPQFDEQELKTALPPQLAELEQELVTSPAGFEQDTSTSWVCSRDELSESKLHAHNRKLSRIYSPVREMDASFEAESAVDSDSEDTASVLDFVVKMNQRSKSRHPNKETSDDMVCRRTPGINKRVNRVKGMSFHGISGAFTPSRFDNQQRYIIELWDRCNVPLVHRSYFFLLIKGELSDSVYLDVELRRLSYLKDTLAIGANITGEGMSASTPNSSLNVLNRERKMLSKQVHKKFSRKEKEELYLKWGIDLKTKHRSIQLAWIIWTNTDLNHVRDSAALVAKLVGFINSGEAQKKTFGFGFLSRRKSRKNINQDTVSTLI